MVTFKGDLNDADRDKVLASFDSLQATINGFTVTVERLRQMFEKPLVIDLKLFGFRFLDGSIGLKDAPEES